MACYNKIVTAINLTSNQKQYHIKDIPDECPICHNKILPSVIAFFYEKDEVQGVFRCTNDDCARMFIGLYDLGLNSYYALSWTCPRQPIEMIFGEEISKLSKMFTLTYNQAISAESSNLFEISGLGYRKALEYLIKDYLIFEHPEKTDLIKKTFLGTCIDTYILDQNLKLTAKRAVWLGNDESHYVRKWENKDITDLKLLIKLSVNWIENILLTHKYNVEMPETKVSTK